MQPDQAVVAELVRRIRDAADPIRIILFGSAARGEMHPDSDLDVLVVMPNGTHRRRTAGYLQSRMIGFGHPVDIQVATPEILDKHKNNCVSMVITNPLMKRYGKRRCTPRKLFISGPSGQWAAKAASDVLRQLQFAPACRPFRISFSHCKASGWAKGV